MKDTGKTNKEREKIITEALNSVPERKRLAKEMCDSVKGTLETFKKLNRLGCFSYKTTEGNKNKEK